jgi:hypothetical protein
MSHRLVKADPTSPPRAISIRISYRPLARRWLRKRALIIALDKQQRLEEL